MKVVYNACYGGFGLSDEALALYKTKVSVSGDFYDWDIQRNDKALIEVVEELGEGANGFLAKLRIEEIPDGSEFEIDEYDGLESVVPPRMSW